MARPMPLPEPVTSAVSFSNSALMPAPPASCRKVMVQAGQDMGLDPLLVRTMVDDYLEREIEDSGGIERYVERVRGDRTDSHERENQLTDELYSITWEQVQTGERPGPLGRPTHDRYVRPGMRRFVYTQVVDTPAWYGELGGNAPAVEFQELLIRHERHGGPTAARELAVKAREQALAGASFDDLMRAVGEVRAEGFVTRADEALIAENDRALSAFLADAEPGDISEVYTPRNGQFAAVALARFVQRVEASLPPFEEPEVQLELDKRTRESLDQTRRGRALDELLRAAYVWPPEARGPQPEGAAIEADDPEAEPPAPAGDAQPAPGPAGQAVPVAPAGG
jgi:hypothetical protein